MHGSDIPLHRLTATAGNNRLAGRMHLQHQLLCLGFGVVEIGHEHMRHIGHEVDRVVPHDSDPWRLRQDFVNWTLGDRGAACWRQALPVRIRHRNHSCPFLGAFAHRASSPPPSSSLAEETTPPLAPPPYGGARFPTLTPYLLGAFA